MITQPELAYMAGIIDGEATLTYRHRPERVHKTYESMLSFNVCYEPLVDYFYDRIGAGKGGTFKDPCSVDCAQLHVHRRLPLYRFSLNGVRVLFVVNSVYSYLLEKQQRARIMLDSCPLPEFENMRPNTKHAVADMLARGYEWPV